jgi:hypothetical protein
LVLEVLDGPPRCSDSAEHHPPALPRAALSKLIPHVEAELEALETLEWLRDLTDEELARRRAFVMFLAALRRSEEAGVERDKPARERVLAALRCGAATNAELQELTGAEAGTRLVRPRFRPIRRPNPHSESRSNPFSDSLLQGWVNTTEKGVYRAERPSCFRAEKSATRPKWSLAHTSFTASSKMRSQAQMSSVGPCSTQRTMM